jgi:hypothetical protein
VKTIELEPEELAVDVDEPDREPETLPLDVDALELEPVEPVPEPPPVLPDETPDPADPEPDPEPEPELPDCDAVSDPELEFPRRPGSIDEDEHAARARTAAVDMRRERTLIAEPSLGGGSGHLPAESIRLPWGAELQPGWTDKRGVRATRPNAIGLWEETLQTFSGECSFDSLPAHFLRIEPSERQTPWF